MNRSEFRDELVSSDIEIFELEEKLKESNKYKAMYFVKKYELEKIKETIRNNLELLPDQVKYNFEDMLDYFKIGGSNGKRKV